MLFIKGTEYVTERMAAKEIAKFWRQECLYDYLECIEPQPIKVAGLEIDPYDILMACRIDYVTFELIPTVEKYYTDIIAENLLDERVKPFTKIRVDEDWIYILPSLPSPTLGKLIEIKESLDPLHFYEVEVQDLIYV